MSWSSSGTPPNRDDRRATGQAGESIAVRHLQAAGYEIVERGWRYGAVGEIDIVARHGKDWVFIEVRSRRATDPGAALESIGRRKQAQVIRLAQAYLNSHNLTNVPWRIDAVAIAFSGHAPPQIEIIENAIGW